MLYSIIAILFGAFLVVFGGIDDSPGGQLLGLIAVLAGILGIVISRPERAIDIELTLNKFGFGKVAENKFQFLCFRFSVWRIPNKYSISFEVNWRVKEKN